MTKNYSKKLYFLVIICAILLNSVSVSAAGDPFSGNAAARGVKNKTLYYIRNKATGLYLDAANRGYTGTKVLQWGSWIFYNS